MNRPWMIGSLVVVLAAGLLFMLQGSDRPSEGENGEAGMGLGPGGPPGDPGGDPARARRSPIGSTPFAGEPKAEPARPRPEIRVRLVHSEGGPAPAFLVLYAGERVIDEAETDDDGGCGLSGRCRGAEFVAFGSGFAPWRSRLDPALREQTLTLPAGHEVAGTVLVEGEGPAPHLLLRLSGARPWPVASRLPQAVWDALSRRDSGWQSDIAAETDREGRFRVTGLVPSWSGRILIPRSLDWIEEGQEELPEPRGGLILRLRRTPALVGRVVDTEGGEAVSGARLRCRFREERGGGSIGGRSDESGLFRLLLPPSVEDLVLQVADGQGMRSREIRLPASLWGGGDAGDVTLARSRTLSLIVHDPEGRPLVGAVAALGEQAGPYSPPTTADGCTTIPVSETVQVVRVGAPGWEIVAVPVPPDLKEPLVVVLRPASTLRIRVVTGKGEPIPQMIVVLGADAPLFNGPEGGPSKLYVIGGATPVTGGQWGGGETRCRYATDSKGQIFLCGILPGQQFQIVVRDDLGVFSETRELTLSPGESGEESFRVPGQLHALGGIVRNRAGDPLGRAHVYVSADGERTRHTLSEAGGRFSFDRLSGEELRLLVRRNGFVPTALEGVVPSDSVPLEIVLAEGREIILEIIDSAGTPVASQQARARVAELEGWDLGFDLFEPEEDGPGRFRFSELPAGVVELEVLVAGRRYVLQHDTAQPRARLEVPVHGALQVRWESALPSDPPLRIRLQTESEGASSLEWEIPFESRDIGDTVLIPTVLPGRYQLVVETIDEEDAESYPAIAGPLVSVVGGRTTECRVTQR